MAAVTMKRCVGTIGVMLCGALAFCIARLSQAQSPTPTGAETPKKVLFVSERGAEKQLRIFTMDADGSHQTGLTTGKAFEFTPALSPNGKQIAFASLAGPRDLKTDLYLMAVDGSKCTQLTHSEKFDYAFAPSWSPDGKHLIFCGGRLAESLQSAHLFTIDADGSNLKQLRVGVIPSWSPTGKQILFTVLSTAPGGDPMLKTMAPDGSDVKKIHDKALMGQWSPDGKKLLYVGKVAANTPGIFLMNADGSGEAPCGEAPSDMVDIAAEWAPDGHKVLVNRGPKGSSVPADVQIFAMDPDGKNVKQLTTEKGRNLLPVGSILPFLFPDS